MDTKNHIRLTPVLTDGTRTAELPQILLNGERAHRLYRRTLALNKRRGKADVTPVFTAIPPDRQRSDYPLPCFPSGSRLDTVRHPEPQEGSHQRQRRESTKRKYPHSGHSTPYSNSNRSFRSPTGQEPGSSYGSLLPPLLPVVPEHHSVSPVPHAPSAKPYFKGSYVSPESDATDERNQKELNFSLDEARVIAEINPQMLSLRELLHRSHQLQEHSGTVLQNHRHQCQDISGKPRCQPQRRCRRHRTGQHTGSRPLSANGFP